MPCHVPLLGVLATLTKKTRLVILQKARYLPDYNLMQTSLDHPEIMQIHCFIKHSKGSCLDFQFILPKIAKEARDIKKTVIFVNTISNIWPIISIIQAQIKQLGYPESSMTQIRPYYSTISKQDKNFIAAAFRIQRNENLECIILIVTNAYSMGLTIQMSGDILISFDLIIQKMGRIEQKDEQFYFIFFSPKQTIIKDEEEITKQLNKTVSPATSFRNTQISNDNRPKALAKAGLLSFITNAIANTSDVESATESQIINFDEDQDNFIAVFLASKVKKCQMQKKKE